MYQLEQFISPDLQKGLLILLALQVKIKKNICFYNKHWIAREMRERATVIQLFLYDLLLLAAWCSNEFGCLLFIMTVYRAAYTPLMTSGFSKTSTNTHTQYCVSKASQLIPPSHDAPCVTLSFHYVAVCAHHCFMNPKTLTVNSHTPASP